MLTKVNDLFGGFAETNELNGIPVVAVANDKKADYKNIREDVGILPMTFTTYFKISGDDAEDTLDTLLTKSVLYLNYGQNRLCYFLEESGEIAAFITLYKNDENFLIEVFQWNEAAVEQILQKSDLTYEKMNYSCILLEGLKTVEFMTEAMELTVDYFVYQSHQESECFEQEILIARTGYTGEFGYKLIGEIEQIQAIWEKLLPEHKAKVVGIDAFEMCHYEIKQPFWSLPYLSLSTNPFEVDYQWMVDFKKDTDYCGKDALLNTMFDAAGERIIGALTDTESIVGDDVLFDSEVVGRVVDSRLSLGLDKYITMILLDKNYAHANLELETANGHKLVTASAPYIFPESWTVGRE